MCGQTKILEAMYYGHGLRIQQIADKVGLSPTKVSQYLEDRSATKGAEPLPAPEPAPLPLHVGPPNDRLFKQGVCKGCSIPLFGGDPIEREWCGECDPRGRLP